MQPAGTRSRVARIVTFDGDLEEAVAEQAVTLVFEDEIDASRGNVVCAADAPADACDRLETRLVWMDEARAVPGRSYLLRIGTQIVGARVSAPLSRRSTSTAASGAPREHAGHQRHRRRCDRPRPAGRVRPVRRQPRHRRPDPDRPHEPRHGRGRDGDPRRAPLRQRPLAGVRGHQGRARRPQGPSAARDLDDRAPGLGQDDDRQPGRAAAARRRRAHAVLDGDNVRHGLSWDLGFTPATAWRTSAASPRSRS